MTPPAVFLAVLRVRVGVPAVVPLPHRQRGDLARAHARALARRRASLGLLTSAYFLAFAAMQIPAGMLLDRYGPRRVEPVLLLIAGGRRAAFAFAGGAAALLVARALIGLGVAVCLMAPLKAIATWYPAERQASLAGWIMVAGRRRRAGGDRAARIRAALRELADDLRRPRRRDDRGRGLDLVSVPDTPKPGDGAGLRRAVGRRAAVFGEPALLVDRAARRLRHGVVHGGAGAVVGAVADGGRGRLARGRRAATCCDGRGDPRRLRVPRDVRDAARAARHPRAAPVRRRLRAATRSRSRAIVLRVPGSCCGGRSTVWAPPSTCSRSPC